MIWDGQAVTNSTDPKHSDFSSAANLSVVEKFYYCAQYLLACTTRDGKVTPSLDGLVVVEPTAWGDQFTLDYNAEVGSYTYKGLHSATMPLSTECLLQLPPNS